jgi:hypothetical protein
MSVNEGKADIALGALARFFSRPSRIHIEKINAPFLFREGGTAAKYGAIERGWLAHQSGTYVKFTQAGADLFA